MTFAKDIGLFLEKIGLTTIIIPFLLTFVIIFAVLQKTKILGKHPDGKPKTKLNAVIAVILGFIVIAYADTVAVINRIAQYGVVLLIAGVVAVIIFAFTGFPKIGKTKIMKIIGELIFILFVFYVLGVFDVIDLSKIETNILIPIIAIITFILAVYFIVKPGKEKPAAKTPKPTPQQPQRRRGPPTQEELENMSDEERIQLVNQDLIRGGNYSPEEIERIPDEAKLKFFEDEILKR